MSEKIKAIDALRVPTDPVAAERYCHEQIEILRREFMMQAQPYVDHLARLHALKPIVISADDLIEISRWQREAADRLGITVPSIMDDKP